MNKSVSIDAHRSQSPSPSADASTNTNTPNSSHDDGPSPPPPSSDFEDPTTPKTIHMTRNPMDTASSSQHLSSSSLQSNSVMNNDMNNALDDALDNALDDRLISSHSASTNNNGSATAMKFQRSVPVHKRQHHQYGNYGYSVTSSTRSVKSVGSSIIDTEDDRSQTGISFMSQDYVVDGGSSTGGLAGAGVGGAVPNIFLQPIMRVPNVVRENITESDDIGSVDELPGKTNWEEEVDDKDVDVDVVDISNNQGSINISEKRMESYMREIQMSLGMGLREIKEQNRRDFERVTATLQNESNRRAALEGRLHAQILLQSETLIAMEVKLLKLEAKVEKREAALRRRGLLNIPNSNIASSSDRQINVNFGDSRFGSSSVGDRSGGVGSAFANFPTSRSGLENGTIEEEQVFDMREIRVNTNESNSRNARAAGATGNGNNPSRTGSGVNVSSNPTNIAVVSSGASLASAVTATSFLDGLEAPDDSQAPSGEAHDDGVSERSRDGDVEDEGAEENDGSASTPTQGSRSHFTNLESILLNPIQHSIPSEHGLSTRAVRGDYYDGNSSLATSMTNTTVASTIVTATTRGNDSINPRSIIAQLTNDTNSVIQDEEGVEIVANSTSISQRGEDIDSMFGLSPPAVTEEHRPPRSRSQSPLTVQSAATAEGYPQSVASASVGTSIISTAAVAPARSFRARRDAAARIMNPQNLDGGRSITNRVVSFTSNEVFSVPPEISEAGDSITMPDELDNLSDVADVLADRGRIWRDEYEARLDAIQKRFGGE